MNKLGRGLIASALVLGVLVGGSIPAQAAECTPIKKELAAPKLGKLYAYAVDLTTGKVLVNVRSGQQTPSASVMKTITAAAAIKFIVKPRQVRGELPYKATTSVLSVPGEPGTLILRGGGDHSLTRVGASSYTTYYLPGEHPAKLRILAANALAALPAGTVINKIVLDDSFFQGKIWNPNWYAYSRTNGDMSPISGLMVDAGRVNPDLTDKAYSGLRVSDPTAQAGRYFKSLLGVPAKDAKIVKGLTPATATVLVSKESQPIENWIRHAMRISDNTETEVIARHTALALRLKNDYTSVQRVGRRLFSSLGADYKQLIMKDASGLAANNLVTPKLLVALMSAAAKPDSDIAMLLDLMATSGDGGTLGGRFLNYNKTTKRYDLVIPKGSIKAKTGYIGSVYSLAGLVTTPDAHQIAFAIFARSDSANRRYIGSGTKTAIDDVVEKLYLCGSTL
jgi:D-alanyl-D-alanine carboxypeptidase/D-alanyl-D-alanine-endopeptidase (penicillin-binding protein 4)